MNRSGQDTYADNITITLAARSPKLRRALAGARHAGHVSITQEFRRI
jgi:hypothetical protein